MTARLGDRLAQRAADAFVGRAAELATLLDALDEGGPPVTYVHGIAGIGKSRLLDAFSGLARAHGATVIQLDCGTIEPTERGFLHELGAAIGGDVTTADTAAERLGALGPQVVLILDTYELFRLLDTWLRQVFLPSLPGTVRVVLASRERPIPAWLTTPGWQGLFRRIDLQALADDEAITMLARAGIGEEDARRINRFARGHPLALTLAAGASSQAYDLGLQEGASQAVIEELTRLYLADVHDPLTREALEAVAVVRRGTLSLLRAMLPRAAPRDAFERLLGLPFIETSRDGLRIHDAVQQAIGAALRAADPNRYRAYRRSAWQQLRDEARTAGATDLWRYTADLLYIIENPAVREAFFPSDAHQYAVEPARPDDGPAIHAICGRHEGPTAAHALDVWWAALPQTFHAVRDRDHRVVGFYCMADLGAIDPQALRDDPIATAWLRHLRRHPLPDGQHVLVLRRWLSLEHGEAPSAIQAACWLDAKRAYMELRPRLRRVYTAVRDLPTYGPTVEQLGFQVILDATIELDGDTYYTGMLDFGPESVDGWLARLVATELGVEERKAILDVEARELALDGRRVSLTRLEFSVVQYLCEREGKPVTRVSLLEDVWGYDYDGGSNVVDVVVRSLRKKLGDRAHMIETVSGVGYRWRAIG